jgi:hypothetical protein
MSRVGQIHIFIYIYMVYKRYFWQGCHQIFGYIRRIHTAKPTYVVPRTSKRMVWKVTKLSSLLQALCPDLFIPPRSICLSSIKKTKLSRLLQAPCPDLLIPPRSICLSFITRTKLSHLLQAPCPDLLIPPRSIRLVFIKSFHAFCRPLAQIS